MHEPSRLTADASRPMAFTLQAIYETNAVTALREARALDQTVSGLGRSAAASADRVRAGARAETLPTRPTNIPPGACCPGCAGCRCDSRRRPACENGADGKTRHAFLCRDIDTG